jgi:hypothetical protein
VLINNFTGSAKKEYAISTPLFSDPARSKHVLLPTTFAAISGIIRPLPPMKKIHVVTSCLDVRIILAI